MPCKNHPMQELLLVSPCHLPFPKGGEGAGGHLREGGLKEAAFLCLLPSPRICPRRSSALPYWAVAAARSFPSLLFTPCPPCLFPPTPSRTACSAFLKDWQACSNCPLNLEYRSAGDRYSLRTSFLNWSGTPNSPHTATLRSKMARSRTTLATFGSVCPIGARCSTCLREGCCSCASPDGACTAE